jgi:hypothetical protein
MNLERFNVAPVVSARVWSEHRSRSRRSITDIYRTIAGRSWTPFVNRRTVEGMDKVLDRFVDRWLKWQDEREARRREQWRRRMNRDQRFGIW